MPYVESVENFVVVARFCRSEINTVSNAIQCPERDRDLEARKKKLPKLRQTFICGYKWMILKVSRIFFLVLPSRGFVLGH